MTEKITDNCKRSKGYDLYDMHSADDTGLFFNLEPSKTLSF
jgi:hypothetical protein